MGCKAFRPAFASMLSGLTVVLSVTSSQLSPAEEAAPAGTAKAAPYYRITDGKVDRSTYLGWWTFHVTCYECHGVDATGTDIAPDLTDRVKQLSPVEFTTKVLTRYHITLSATEAMAENQAAIREAIVQEVLRHERGEQGEILMPAWEPDFRVKPHVMDLYAYLQARADGALGPGKPELLPGEFLWRGEQKEEGEKDE